MSRKFTKNRLTALSEINLTPLIDLAFALLIIFMITTPLMEQSIKIQLPVESTKTQAQKNPQIPQVIALDEQGNIFWKDQKVSNKEFTKKIQDLTHKESDPTIDLRADAKVRYQHVISVMDVLKSHNIKKISLNTQAG